MRPWLTTCLLLAASLPASAQAAGTLRFGLDFDFETFDPARSGSYIERVVNTAMCDQLIDIDPQLNLVPQLATSWEWSADKLALTLHLRQGVVFSDGAPLDAEAVRANIERYRVAPYSLRRSELKSLTGVDVVDPTTVRIRLSEPFTPLLVLLANRPGVMLSPRILGRSSDEIAAHPVCAGPFTLAERVAQDHITLKRSPELLERGQRHARHGRVQDHDGLDRAPGQPAIGPTRHRQPSRGHRRAGRAGR